MKYTIDTKNENSLNWSAKGDERIVQNVLNLLNTYKYEIAYNRLLGLNSDLIDKPLSEVQSLLSAEIIEQVQRFEPRAEIESVNFIKHEKGDIYIKAVLKIE